MKTKFILFGIFITITLPFFSYAQWSPFGSTNDDVNDFEVYDSLLLMGGRFGTADNIPANGLAFWTEGAGPNKGNWDEYANISGYVYDLITYQNTLYVAGSIGFINFLPAYNIAKYSGANWSSVGSSGVNGTFTQGTSVAAHSMAIFLGELYVAGTFTAASGVAQTNNIAKWDGLAWSSVGGGIFAQQYSGVRKLYVYGDALYASGSFSVAGGVPVTNIAKWDGTSWSAVANFGQASLSAATIYDFVEYNGDLYAAGNFSVINGLPANKIARFDGTNWSDASNGMYSGVYVSALAVYNNELYASGYFNIAGSSKTNNIAKWNGTSWKIFGAVDGGNVDVLSVKHGSLLAGGYFNALGDSSCVNVARYAPQNLVGLAEQHDETHICIAPNPFLNTTTISFSKEMHVTNIQLVNVVGQVIRSYDTVNANQLIIERGDLSPGIYFLKIAGLNGEHTLKKLIVSD